MVIVTETDSGIRLTGTTDYDDEVLNSGWVPCPELRLQPAVGCYDRRPRKLRSVVDPDEFLRGIYRLQE